MYYLEWFCGQIIELNGRLANLPDDPEFEVTAMASLAFASGGSGSLTVSSGCFLGSGHRLEFYGEDGTLVLENKTIDYMRRFTLQCARRPAGALEPVAVDPDQFDASAPDGRIAPVSRLVGRFLDAIEQRRPASPGFAEAYRVQVLLDAIRRSHDTGNAVKTSETAETPT